MSELNWRHKSKRDFELVSKIADRALRIAAEQGEDLNKMEVMMDVTCVHLNIFPLRLADLLEADGFNFTHDISGIFQHLNLETGELENCFVPRFVAQRT